MASFAGLSPCEEVAYQRRWVPLRRTVAKGDRHDAHGEGGARQVASRFRGELVFCAENGTPIDPENFTKRDWARALRRSGLRRIRFHDLRHTYASLLIAQGAHPK